jgi:hypothetical protein
MRISVTLSQSPDASEYTVEQITGSVEVAIGQAIPREVVRGWCTKSHVTVRVIGLTAGDQDLALFDGATKQLTTGKKGTK